MARMWAWHVGGAETGSGHGYGAGRVTQWLWGGGAQCGYGAGRLMTWL